VIVVDFSPALVDVHRCLSRTSQNRNNEKTTIAATA